MKTGMDGPMSQFIPVDGIHSVTDKQRALAKSMKFFYGPYDDTMKKNRFKQTEDTIKASPLLMLRPQHADQFDKTANASTIGSSAPGSPTKK